MAKEKKEYDIYELPYNKSGWDSIVVEKNKKK